MRPLPLPLQLRRLLHRIAYAPRTTLTHTRAQQTGGTGVAPVYDGIVLKSGVRTSASISGSSISRRILSSLSLTTLPTLHPLHPTLLPSLKKTWLRCLPTLGQVDRRESASIVARDGSNATKWWVGQPVVNSNGTVTSTSHRAWEEQREVLKQGEVRFMCWWFDEKTICFIC